MVDDELKKSQTKRKRNAKEMFYSPGQFTIRQSDVGHSVAYVHDHYQSCVCEGSLEGLNEVLNVVSSSKS